MIHRMVAALVAVDPDGERVAVAADLALERLLDPVRHRLCLNFSNLSKTSIKSQSIIYPILR